MGALIVLDVHNITVIEQLLAAGCRGVNDFDWSKQLRYYWDTNVTTSGHPPRMILRKPFFRLTTACVDRRYLPSSRYIEQQFLR